MFLIFGDFEPRCSYKIVLIKKKVYISEGKFAISFILVVVRGSKIYLAALTGVDAGGRVSDSGRLCDDGDLPPTVLTTACILTTLESL